MHLTQIVILSPRRLHAQEARASSMARLQRAAAVRSPGGQDLQTGPLASSIDGVELVERAPNAGLDRAVGAPVSGRRPAGRLEPETAGRRSPEAGANSGRSRHISVEETTLSLRQAYMRMWSGKKRRREGLAAEAVAGGSGTRDRDAASE
jgi:hypothetical protein